MPQIVLATLNARYSHTSFGLRCLFANMGTLRAETVIQEFVINDSPVEILATLLEQSPAIIGLGVYIWNVEPLTRLVADLKQVRPDVCVVLGGPEVSYEYEQQPIVQLADYLITGEADLAFPALCRDVLQGRAPAERVIHAATPALSQIALPYDHYSEHDIAQRVIYVEASRGCPFTCEFCLSALEIPLRQFDTDAFLDAMQRLLDRGVNQFKFVDRTFNLNLNVSHRILTFFLERFRPGMFLHFEMIPDRLPVSLRDLIRQFPPGALQFEIGVQTFDPHVGELISRRQDNDKLADNFHFLRQQTGVHIHADLIVGLPGETWESFAAGFDRLYALRPQEIQIGILKRLKGTPIVRHDAAWQMVYSPHPPFEILSNRLLSFQQIHRLRRLARYWDMIGNSGNFVATISLMLDDVPSPFSVFAELSEWLYQTERRLHGIALVRLMELVFQFLIQVRAIDAERIAEAMWKDYQRVGRRDIPAFLRRFDLQRPGPPRKKSVIAPVRQRRHLAD
jgi:radical SAM superfamily enzyme YgiQ (UPF0313 family)